MANEQVPSLLLEAKDKDLVVRPLPSPTGAEGRVTLACPVLVVSPEALQTSDTKGVDVTVAGSIEALSGAFPWQPDPDDEKRRSLPWGPNRGSRVHEGPTEVL
ncbi:hypothetical protein GN956_G9316 [Arapaima gigas]